MSSADILAAIQKVETTAVFADFVTENPHHYLVHVFSAGTGLELGYYGKEDAKITVFTVDPVSCRPPEPVFQETQHVLDPLDVASVRLGFEDALKCAEEQRAKLYAAHMPLRLIAVLQQRDVPVWNMTIVTMTMQMIILKLSAIDGSLVDAQMNSLLTLTKE